MPRLKPKSTANFLAIKRQQQTKNVEVAKLQRSSLKIEGHDRQKLPS
jgi:hypothetical protein